MTGTQERINVLQTTVNNSIDTIILQHELKGVVEGSRIAIEMEEMHVLAAPSTAPGSSITVIRGYAGSTAASHTAGAIIRCNPQFSDYRISQEVNDELKELSSPEVGMFQIKPLEFQYNPAQSGYNISAADLIDIWRVRYDTPGPYNDWPMLRRDEWYLDQHANTTDFPGGKQLVLRVAGFPGFTVRVSYKAKFTSMVTYTDDVAVIS